MTIRFSITPWAVSCCFLALLSVACPGDSLPDKPPIPWPATGNHSLYDEEALCQHLMSFTAFTRAIGSRGGGLGGLFRRWSERDKNLRLSLEQPVDITEALLWDERMSAANSLRDFMERLPPGKDREVLGPLLLSPAFARLWLEGGNQTMELVDLPLEAVTLPGLNRRLEELSMRIHLEIGGPLCWLVLRMESGADGRHRLFLDRQVRPFADRRLEVSPQWMERFAQALAPDRPRARYVSAFEDTIQHVVVLTHNRDGVVPLLEEVAKNLEHFGHAAGLTLHVFDDSNDEGRQARRRRICALAPGLSQKGITLNYVGQDEREKKRRRYEGAVRQHFSGETQSELLASLEFLLGRGRGVGANRNWVMLEMGPHNFVMVDDDVHPYADVEVRESIQRMPVDFLGGLNRALHRPGARAAGYEFVGHEDTLLAQSVIGDGPRWVVYNSKQKAHRPSFSDGGIHPPGIGTLSRGGVLAVMPASWGLEVRVPTIASLRLPLRAEDFVLGHLIAFLADPTYGDVNDPLFIWRPGGAVLHQKVDRPRPEQLPLAELGEQLWTFFPSLFAWIRFGEVLPGSPRAHSPAVAAELFPWLASEIVALLDEAGPPMGPMLGVREALNNYLRWMLRIYQDRSPSGRYLPTQDTLNAIKQIFDTFGIDPNDPDSQLTTLDGTPFERVFKVEIHEFARALRQWPLLVELIDSFNHSGRLIPRWKSAA